MDSNYENDFLGEKFFEIIPAEYAQDLKIRFQSNPDLWYSVILPKQQAENFRKETGNDYSKIWHVHCNNCWKSIDKNTIESCFVSEDEITWLCFDCYNELLKKGKIK